MWDFKHIPRIIRREERNKEACTLIGPVSEGTFNIPYTCTEVMTQSDYNPQALFYRHAKLKRARCYKAQGNQPLEIVDSDLLNNKRINRPPSICNCGIVIHG